VGESLPGLALKNRTDDFVSWSCAGARSRVEILG